MKGAAFFRLNKLRYLILYVSCFGDKFNEQIEGIQKYLRAVDEKCVLEEFAPTKMIQTTNNANEVACESVEPFLYRDDDDKVETCFMLETTSINEPNFTIATNDTSIKILSFFDNKKISFLPVHVGETFPNLLNYGASRCAIKEILKENFKGLSKLNYLYLDQNQIKRIPSDTFEDLEDLKYLFLGNNVILFCDLLLLNLYCITDNNNIVLIDGAVFRGLNKLTDVDLNKNACIDKRFITQEDIIQKLQQTVDEKCSPEKPPTTAAITRLVNKLETLESSLNSKLAQIHDFESQITQDNVQISSLLQSKSELTSNLENLKILKLKDEIENSEIIKSLKSKLQAEKDKIKEQDRIFSFITAFAFVFLATILISAVYWKCYQKAPKI